MEISFNIDENDLLSLEKHALKNSRLHYKGRNYINRWIATIIMFLFGIFIPPDGFPLSTFELLLTFVTTFLMYHMYPYILQASHLSNTKSLIKKNYLNLQGKCNVILSDEEIIVKMEHSKNTYSWDIVKKVIEDDKRYFLFISDFKGIIIHKNNKVITVEKELDFNKFIQSKFKDFNLKND